MRDSPTATDVQSWKSISRGLHLSNGPSIPPSVNWLRVVQYSMMHLSLAKFFDCTYYLILVHFYSTYSQNSVHVWQRDGTKFLISQHFTIANTKILWHCTFQYHKRAILKTYFDTVLFNISQFIFDIFESYNCKKDLQCYIFVWYI